MSIWQQKKAILAYLLTSLFLCYAMALQVAPSAISHKLMQDLHFDAREIGLIGSAYFYAYTFMQIPVGLLCDRFTVFRLLLAASLICLIGQIAFVTGHTLWPLMIGRFLIGLGSAFAFVLVLIVANTYFPSHYFALLVGIAQLLAALGAMAGTAPLAIAINLYDWHTALMALMTIGWLLLSLTYLTFPTQEKALRKASSTPIKNVLHLIKNAQVCWIALYAVTNWAPIMIFAALWGVPFLVSKLQITPHEASSALALIWIGISVASPFLGWLSDFIKRRKQPALYMGLVGAAASTIMIYGPKHDPLSTGLMLLLMGIASSGQILTFAMMKDIVDEHHIGTAIGLNNMAVVAGGLLQALIGTLVQQHWNGQYLHDTPHYSLSDYRAALWIIPFCYILNVVLCLTALKESHPEQTPARA